MPVYEFAGFRLDADKRLLLQRDGAAVGLTPKAYETLAYLVEHSGAVVQKEQMIRAIWPDTAVEEKQPHSKHLAAAACPGGRTR
jgi:DNA-binding winged helix-turn-helix (wHTH) protein